MSGLAMTTEKSLKSYQKYKYNKIINIKQDQKMNWKFDVCDKFNDSTWNLELVVID
jgi:hypothetical protein